MTVHIAPHPDGSVSVYAVSTALTDSFVADLSPAQPLAVDTCTELFRGCPSHAAAWMRGRAVEGACGVAGAVEDAANQLHGVRTP